MDTLLEELLSWLGNNEGTLIALEHQELPNSIPPTEVLITEHQEFMESMAKRTTEVDTVIKAKQIKERKVSKKTRYFFLLLIKLFAELDWLFLLEEDVFADILIVHIG